MLVPLFVTATALAGADFVPFEDALRSGDTRRASDALVAIVDDPTQADGHGRAWRQLAGLLENEGLSYAALLAWTRALEADPEGTKSDLVHVLALAAAHADESLIAPVLAGNLGVTAGLDANARSRVAYLAARDHLRKDNLGTALGILMMVEAGTEVYADAEALRGVVLANQGRFADAIAPLLTAQGAATQAGNDTPAQAARFRGVIDLNVGRSYYGQGNWVQAIQWFSQVDRASEYWPEAQFEKAWAYFRAEDMPGALAQLHNHDAPFFDDWYFPEADLLRAYALFMMCKFPSASAEMDEFVATYTPIREEIDRLGRSLGAAEAFADAQRYLNGEASQMPAMIVRSFRHDDRLEEAVQSLALLEAELAELPAHGDHAYATRAGAWLTARKDARITEEGARVLDRLQRAQGELGGMLQGIEITRLDLLNLETEMYERAAATGKLDFGDRVGKLRDLRKARKGFRVWPYQGEFWMDELGWYVVDARPDCPASMAVGAPE